MGALGDRIGNRSHCCSMRLLVDGREVLVMARRGDGIYLCGGCSYSGWLREGGQQIAMTLVHLKVGVTGVILALVAGGAAAQNALPEAPTNVGDVKWGATLGELQKVRGNATCHVDDE